MPVWKEDRTHFFVCDVCSHQVAVEERKKASWDEVRLIPVRLKEDGWRLTKPHGHWEALCPDCAQHSGYRMDLEDLD